MRARFNDAIARRDSAFIAGIILPSYHIVSGRSSQRDGQDAAMQNWSNAFRDSTLLYARTPSMVVVNEQWGLAEEVGNWTGHLTAVDGVAKFTGVYSAKWQRSRSGKWMLQAEIFTTMSCVGGPVGCNPPDPVGP